MTLTIDSTVALSNGVEMPRLGLGVFKAEDGREVEQAVAWAIQAGYRSIDTAAFYHNEGGVGRAIRDSGMPRESIFVTTKIWNDDQRRGATQKAFDDSLARLGLDYIDLYLVHWPVAGYFKQTWQVLESIYRSGRARAIGVSNFMVHHLEQLLEGATVPPVVNQIEFHPWLQSPDLIAFCQDHSIQVEAWSPLIKGRALEIKVLREIGAAHGKNAVQVTLRWILQRGLVAIPKSSKKQRIDSNADLYDFELTANEMARIDDLNRGQRVGPDPFTFRF